MKTYTITLNFLVILTLLFSSCMQNKVNNKTQKQKKKKPLFVNTQFVKQKNIQSYIKITGTIKANKSTYILSNNNGVVDKLFAHENQYVKKGSLIAIINPNKRLNLIAKNKLKVNQLKKELGTYTKSNQNYTSVKQKLEDAQKELKYAYTMYQTNPIICTTNGMVTDKNIEIGSQVNTHDKIIEITDMSSLVIKAEINEKYFGAIKKGTELAVQLNAYPNKKLKGVVSLIYPKINATTRTILFDIKLKNFSQKLLPGMMAIIQIPTQKVDNAIVIPFNAVLSSPNEKQFVFYIDKQNRAHKQFVKTGITQGKLIEIIEGLNLGHQIVTKGQEKLKDNKQVKVVGTKKLIK